MPEETGAPPSASATLVTGTAHDSQPAGDAGGTTTATGGAPAAAPETTAAAGGDAPWYAKIENADLRGLAESRSFDSPEKVLKSYSDLEKLRGVPADKLLRLPDSMEDADSMGAVYDKLGRPTAADGYTVEGMEQGKENQWFFDAMHKAGVSNANAGQVSAAINAQLEAHNAFETQQFANQAQVEMQELKTEWGQAYDAKHAGALAIVSKLELTEAEVGSMERAIGTKNLMNKLAAMGAMIGEATVVEGQGASGGGFQTLTPEGARAERDRLNADPEFVKRLMSPDKTVRQKAMDERRKLSVLGYD